MSAATRRRALIEQTCVPFGRESDESASDIEASELDFPSDGSDRGFWDRERGRVKGGMCEGGELWAGLPDASVMRVGLRVLGGPWAFVRCDMLSVSCLS
jgi:hypothetical protein